MSLQWEILAYCLYTEVAIVLLLLLPFISPIRWHSLFNSSILSRFKTNAKPVFYVLVAVLLLLFVDSTRAQWAYSVPTTELRLELSSKSMDQLNKNRFLAQRNAYISGFSLFLFLVIYRLCILLSCAAHYSLEAEAALSQAEGSRKMAETLLNQSAAATGDRRLEDQNARNELAAVKEELRRRNVEFEALKSQAESTNREYDRLLGECDRLRADLHGAGGAKKDD